jgi:hypothetical protein
MGAAGLGAGKGGRKKGGPEKGTFYFVEPRNAECPLLPAFGGDVGHLVQITNNLAAIGKCLNLLKI